MAEVFFCQRSRVLENFEKLMQITGKYMKKTLFFTFIFVFVATAVITLLGIIKVIDVDSAYLGKLFYLLIAESVAPVIALFKKTNFFDKEQGNSKMSVVLLPKEAFPKKADPHNCTVTIFNQDTDEERHIAAVPKRANGYLSMFLDSLSDQELIKVRLVNTANESWESEYFNPSVAKAEMEKI